MGHSHLTAVGIQWDDKEKSTFPLPSLSILPPPPKIILCKTACYAREKDRIEVAGGKSQMIFSVNKNVYMHLKIKI